MTLSMALIVFCLIIITIIALYFPIAYIRLTNKVLNTLKQIETNTRK
jgi:hypothetical protein